jgi:hypothetical protein
MRYFRCLAGDEAYEQARLALDAAWGHPNAQTMTQTCIDPAALAPRDAAGRIVLAVNDEFCAYPAAEEMLGYMIGSGAAAEITEAEYRDAVQQSLQDHSPTL